MQIFKLDELANREPDPELIPGLLDQGFILAVGAPATGKTFFAIHAAVHIALGEPWQGRKVDQGPVVYCVAEGVSHFSHRVTTYVDKLERSVDGMPFYVVAHSMNMRASQDGAKTEDIEKLEQAIDIVLPENETPRLIVFDTLNRYMPGGDENNQQDCSALVRGVEFFRYKYGCSIMLLHHMKKDGTMPRGSTVLTGAADQVIHAVSRKGSLVSKPVRWTTKDIGKRKDRADVDQWFRYYRQNMSRGNRIEWFNNPTEDSSDVYVYETVYDDEGHEVLSQEHITTLLLEPIDRPADAKDEEEEAYNAKEQAILDLLKSNPVGMGVNEACKSLGWNVSTWYPVVRTLIGQNLVIQDAKKKYRLVTSDNPFEPY